MGRPVAADAHAAANLRREHAHLALRGPDVADDVAAVDDERGVVAWRSAV
jgi:hypothetical protein